LSVRRAHSDIEKLTSTRRRALACTALLSLAAAATFAAPLAQGKAEDAPPLRLCADPTNLPFSSDNPSQPGLYLEIGQALARALGRPVSYDWYKSYFGKRTVRVTLLGKQCDAMIGLPLSEDFMGPAVIFSDRIARESYALVSANDHAIGALAELKGKRVAVQYETTPQNLLAERDDVTMLTVLSPDEGMKALAEGKADAAFIWGPVAGWLNKTSYGGRFHVQPTEGKGLSFDVAIGFAKKSSSLRDEVNATLPQLQRTIEELAVKYGAPTEPPLKFGTGPAAIRLASIDPPTRSDATATQAASLPETRVAENTATAANTETISVGKEIFNGTCAHCHGPDAVQSERRINLRLLHNRYGDDMRTKFWTTVHDGRPAKGMPAWKEVFTDDQFESIYAYLLTVQTPPE
jgi:ABC-type amino acid transport substrate-binding protein/mono/diheme cytochrome c family protein